jgi:zinc transport system ATP-binding protein
MKYSAPLLELRNVTVAFSGRRILDNVSFEMKSGEIVAIIGPNGAGKTTLLKAILGIVPYEGDIFVSGKKPDVREMGYVPQYFRFDSGFPITVSELIGMSYYSPKKKDIISIVKEAGIYELKDRLIGELSGGELQKVMIARSAIKRPKLWLLDEAVSGIDASSMSGFFDMAEKMRGEWGAGVVIISHEMDLVYKLADKVVCLNNSLIFEGKPEDALSSSSLEKLYGKEYGFVIKK